MESICSERCKNVFHPCITGGIYFRNHILRAATNEYCGNTDGSMSDEQIAILRELAQDDVGGIITANYFVRGDGRLDSTQNAIDASMDMDACRKMVNEVHRYGSKVIIQISHAGAKSKVSKKLAEYYSDLSTCLK